MTTWQSADVRANGIRMHYTRTDTRTGGNRRAVVLAHGVTDDGLCWTPVAERLAADYDVIMVDARGHGLSEGPESGYDMVTQAADLQGLILALGLDKPALIGHSMGAAAVLALAGLYPATPSAILLEDPPAWWVLPPAAAPAPAPGHDAPPPRDMAAWFTSLRSKTREQLMAEAHAANPTWAEGELGPWADSKLRFSPNIRQIMAGFSTTAIDWPATLRQITCPALAITADPARGAILTDDGARALQACIPGLAVVRLAGAGHNVRREQFDPFMDATCAFLAQVSAPV